MDGDDVISSETTFSSQLENTIKWELVITAVNAAPRGFLPSQGSKP